MLGHRDEIPKAGVASKGNDTPSTIFAGDCSILLFIPHLLISFARKSVNSVDEARTVEVEYFLA